MPILLTFLRKFLYLLSHNDDIDPMKKETLNTIAERTGYSITTVSRVLSGNASKYRISKSTCETVIGEARRCNYMPSQNAQILRSVKSGMIGLLVPSISNPFFADMASVVITELRRKGYTTIVIDSMENETLMLDGVKSLIQRQVEGIIAIPCGEDALALERLGKQIPVVTIDRYYENTTLPFVTTNNYQGGLDGTNKLIARGHRRIACIQGATGSMPSRERVRGYLDAMSAAGLLGESLVIGNDFTIRNGYLETKLLLSAPVRPTAIFTLSNTILLGALKALGESSVKVPADMALLSFDDNVFMDYLTPSIARMGQPTADMATLAVKILLDKISGRTGGNSQIKLSPTFIQGESM